jgi:predicted aldo/keto reductase-like oxidoreductase
VARQIAIAAPLRYLMYHECYGKTERARELYRELPAMARAFSDTDLKQACRVCPQGIDIPGRLRRARDLLA